MEPNQVLEGDCLELLKTLPDSSVGMFLCDLPYGCTACHWDKRIDIDALWGQVKRLLQPKRAAVFTATQPFTTDLICSNRDWFKYCWVWDKVNRFSGHLNAKREPLRVYEDILIFGEKRPDFYPQYRQGKGYNVKTCSFSKAYGSQRSVTYRSDGSQYSPINLLRIPGDTKAEGQINSTQKPVALFEYLIRTYTNPGDIVVDPTAGSMTTAIAAINTGRGYICMEKDPEEYRKGLQRVEEHLTAPRQISLLEPTPEPQAAPTPAKQQLSIFDLVAS